MRTWLILLLLTGIITGTHARAQALGVVQSDILVIDIDRLLNETVYGKRLQSELDAARERLIARNDRIAAELEAEEGALTAQRALTTPEAFRDLADNFDAKVTELRRESERLSRELERRRDLGPIQFMRVAQPVLAELVQEADAVVLMDVRSVILRADVADVTDLAIARIDARIGAGPTGLPPLTESEDNLAPAPAE
ncbi:OmpH family outer membrane protein [Roseovarius autotrophicus]|uniref:OmpH family outer membrane protein n=1 Tax=Roseovarius autotrophicus TaxID=2824121 RepID=UPI0019E83053|nr:OmpH family outer membrane protein [Roseovarius autotrophicus]MBE0454197.1 OmpH family outer membrane protein [Roseovarius sp.]